MTRILGVDPGTLRVGWGVIEGAGAAWKGVAWGVIRARGPLPSRLLAIFEALTAIAAEHRPDILSLEDVFHGKDVRAMEKIGEGRAIAKLVAARAAVTLAEYPPATVKLSVAGHGGASKESVGRMVVATLGLASQPRPADATDALALALCHALRGSGPSSRPRASRRRGWTTADVARLPGR